MTILFISHSSEDKEETDRVRACLKSCGYESYFLDYDEKQGIPASEKWEQVLYQRLEAAQALIFIATGSSIRSQWCFHEIATCRARGIDFFPLVFDDVPFNQIFPDIQFIKFDGDWGKLCERLADALKLKGYDLNNLPPWDAVDFAERGPFPGLDAFGEADAQVFFGRDKERISFIRKMTQDRLKEANRAFVISGVSGAGKSSFLRAGVYPRLRLDAENWVCTDPIEAASDVEQRFLKTVDGLTERVTGRSGTLAARQDVPPSFTDLVDETVRALDNITDTATGRGPVVFALDQAEQLVGRSADEDKTQGDQRRFWRSRHDFMDFYGAVSNRVKRPPVLLATVRNERVGALQTSLSREGIVFDVFVLPPIARTEVPALIERPALVHGLRIERALVRRLVGEIGDQIELLPLLAYVLRRLYESRDSSRGLTLQSYEADIGSIERSVGQIAEDLIGPYLQTGPDQKTVLPAEIRTALCQLAHFRSEEALLARDVPFSEIPEAAKPLFREMLDVRLLRPTLENKENEEESAAARDSLDDATAPEIATVRVSHEILFSGWDRLKTVLGEGRDVLKIRTEIDDAARSWDQCESGAEDYLIHDRGRLAHVRVLTAEGKLTLDTPESRRYIDACIAAEEHRVRRRRMLFGTALIASLVTSVVLYTLYQESQESLAISRHNLGLSRLAEAERVLEDGFPTRAHLLAGTSAGTLRYTDGEKRAALLRPDSDVLVKARTLAFVTERARQLPTAAVREDHTLTAIAASPDGRFVATGNILGTVRLYDADTLELLESRQVHSDQVNDLKFAKDSTRIYSASFDDTVAAWNLVTGETRPFSGGHQTDVSDILLDEGNNRLIATDFGLAILVWDLQSGTFEKRFAPASAAGTALDLSPDGEVLAVALADGSLVAFDVETSAPLFAPVSAHDGATLDVAFDASGRRIATVGYGATAKIWDLDALIAGGETPIKELEGHRDNLFRVSFVDSRRQIVTGSWDGSVAFWNANSYAPEGRIDGHNGWVYDFDFSLDGTVMFTASEDSFLRRWDLRDLRPTTDMVLLEGQNIMAGRIDRLRQNILVGGRGGGAMLFQTAAGGRGYSVACPFPERGNVFSLAFDPTGRYVAIGYGVGAATPLSAVVIYSRAECDEHQAPLLGSHEVYALEFSPDGKRLAAGDDEGVVHIFDVATGATLASKPIHAGSTVRALDFSRDGIKIVTAGEDAKVHILSSADLSAVGAPMTRHAAPVWSVDIDPQDRFVASAGEDKTTHVWRLDTPDEVHRSFTSPGNSLTSVIFLGDGAHVVTSGDGRRVEVWDLDSGAKTFVLDTLVGLRGVLDSTPDGKTLLLDGGGGVLRIVDLPLGSSPAVSGERFVLDGIKVEFR